MYSLFDIYKELILSSKNNIKIYLNNDLNRYIFSFVIDDFKKIINETFIKKHLEKSIIQSNFLGKPLIVYYDNFPYPELVKNINLKELINSKLDIHSNLYFSHYLYNNDGIYYKNIDNCYKRLFYF